MENLTVKDFKEYLSKFKDEEELSLVIVNNHERVSYKIKETMVLKEKPVIFFSVNEGKNLDEEREINE